MAFAGLWESWIGPNGEEQDTACIITTDANGLMSGIHDRMPVILEAENFDLWLDNFDTEVADASGLMKPAGEDVLEAIEISPLVNKVSNDSPLVQEPVRPQPAATSKSVTRPPAGQASLF